MRIDQKVRFAEFVYDSVSFVVCLSLEFVRVWKFKMLNDFGVDLEGGTSANESVNLDSVPVEFEYIVLEFGFQNSL